MLAVSKKKSKYIFYNMQNNMTNEQIIWGMVIAITSVIFSVLLTIILSIYAKEYIPDKNKLNLYIRKFLSFTFRYISPISLIIYFFINDDLNKLFVLKIIILTSTVIFNSVFDSMNSLLRVSKNIYSIVNLLSDSQKSNTNNTIETIERTIELVKHHDIILNDIVEKNKPELTPSKNHCADSAKFE
jgi:hypothetical protein